MIETDKGKVCVFEIAIPWFEFQFPNVSGPSIVNKEELINWLRKYKIQRSMLNRLFRRNSKGVWIPGILPNSNSHNSLMTATETLKMPFSRTCMNARKKASIGKSTFPFKSLVMFLRWVLNWLIFIFFCLRFPPKLSFTDFLQFYVRGACTSLGSSLFIRTRRDVAARKTFSTCPLSP